MNEYELQQLDKAVNLFLAGEIDAVWSLLTPLLKAYPDSPDLQHLHALLLMRQHQWQQAKAIFERFLPLYPRFATLRYCYGLLLLALGELPQGWLNYEWRREIVEFNHTRLALPYWHQGALHQKHLLVVAEQGYGDTLQFLRYLPLIKPRFHPKTITLLIPDALHELLHTVPNVNEVMCQLPAKLPDIYITMLSLPKVFETTLDNIPAPFDQYHISPERQAKWREKICSPKFKIGCAWFGRPLHENNHNRSMNIGQLAPLFTNPNVQFYSLQKDAPNEIFRQYPLIDLANQFENFADTAAAIQALDLIISVDTAVVHLAASLGKPTWVLLPYSTDWRWLINTQTSPWYPSIKLYQQTQYKRWDDVIDRVFKDVAKKTG